MRNFATVLSFKVLKKMIEAEKKEKKKRNKRNKKRIQSN